MSVQSVVGSPPSSLFACSRPLKSNEEMGRNGSRFDVELRLAPESTPARPASALQSLRAAAGPRPPHPTHSISIFLLSKGTASAGYHPPTLYPPPPLLCKVKVKSLSHVRLLVTPWTAAHQAPPSMGFSRQEYWSGVPLLCKPDPKFSPYPRLLPARGRPRS